MINIKSNQNLPELIKPFTAGQLSDGEPYQFTNGGYEQSLTKSEWETLKKFAEKPAKEQDADEENGTTDQGRVLPSDAPQADDLAELKAQYEAYPHKNDKKGREMRAKIKELEQAEDK